MYGRENELGDLTSRWAAARAARGGSQLVSGEPGIGKSRLIWALQQHVAQSPDAFLIRLDCSPYFVNTAFQPVIQHLEHVLEFGPDDGDDQRLDKIAGLLAQYGFDLPSTVPIVAKLLRVNFDGRYGQLEAPPERQRQLTIDVLVKIIVIRAAHQPVLVVVEDLHWADPSTLDVLTQLIEHVPSTRQLVVFSSRPEFVPPWSAGPRLGTLNLNRLDRDAAASIVTEVAGKALSREMLVQLVGKADGVPLYLEELTKLMVEQGLMHPPHGRSRPGAALPELSIPATLADSLTARLDRLGDAKGVAQLGAVIGRQFSWALLEAVCETTESLDGGALAHNLERLVHAGVVYAGHDQQGESYTFKHALIQDAAYSSLLRSTRRQYHRIIAQALTERFPDTVDTAPELLARHYTQAGMVAESVPCWLSAGERALARLGPLRGDRRSDHRA